MPKNIDYDKRIVIPEIQESYASLPVVRGITFSQVLGKAVEISQPGKVWGEPSVMPTSVSGVNEDYEPVDSPPVSELEFEIWRQRYTSHCRALEVFDGYRGHVSVPQPESEELQQRIYDDLLTSSAIITNVLISRGYSQPLGIYKAIKSLLGENS